jgi:hypothetical protein
MNQALQAIQQFFADLWHQFNSGWLPVIEAKLLLFWEWLLANPVATLGISAVLLFWACLVIRKSTHHGWSFVRVLLLLLLLAFGIAGMAIVFHLA